MRVYIAGPVTTSGTQADNLHRAAQAAQALIKAGHYPFVPNLYFLLEVVGTIDRQAMMEQCKVWLLQCDAMVRLPGPSHGADQEESWAYEAGIPVFKMGDERIGDYMTPVRAFLDEIRTGRLALPSAPSMMDQVETVMNLWQEEVGRWLKAQPFGNQDGWEPVMGMAEEAGEACHAMLKMHQNIRGSKTQHLAALADAVGDISIYGAGTALAHGFRIGTAIRRAWLEVGARDWNKNQETGRMTGADRGQPSPYSEGPRHPKAGE